MVRLDALPPGEIASLLSERSPELRPQERELVARLSEGAPGRALRFELAAYASARNDASTVLGTLEHTGDHATLFRMTEGYRAGADGQEKTQALLGALASLLEDLLLLQHGAEAQLRNIDKRAELNRLADTLSFATIESAMRGLDAVRSGMRRNLLRALSLDAFALGLGFSVGL